MDMAITNSDKDVVAKITKSVIERNGLSMSRFASDLGTDRQRVFQWVNGSTIPNTKIVAAALFKGRNSPGKEHLLEWGRGVLDGLAGED